MKIDLNYVEGVTDTVKQFYEDENGTIPADKELTMFFEHYHTNDNMQIIGFKITFTWKTWVSNKWDKDSEYGNNQIIVFEKEKLSSFISDLNTIFSDIHLQAINY